MSTKRIFSGVIMVIIMSLSITYGQQQCQVLIVPSGPRISVDPNRLMGTWYEYMYRTPGLDDTNTVNVYTSLGQAITQSSPGMGLTGTMTVTFLLQPQNKQCMGIFSQTNFTTDGRKISSTWMPGQSQPAPLVYYVLYTDYSTLEIAYRCGDQPLNTNTGICSSPWFFINTRQKAQMLSSAAKTYVANAVNYFLAPFCMSAQDLKFTGWNDSLPACQPTPPADFTQLAQSLSRSSNK